MWPFDRKTGDGRRIAPTGPSTDRLPVAGDVDHGADDSVIAPPAWVEAPSIERLSARPIERTIRSRDGVKDDLVVLRSTRISGRLEHVVSSTAPAGSVIGLLTPSVQRYEVQRAEGSSSLPAWSRRNAGRAEPDDRQPSSTVATYDQRSQQDVALAPSTGVLQRASEAAAQIEPDGEGVTVTRSVPLATPAPYRSVATSAPADRLAGVPEPGRGRSDVPMVARTLAPVTAPSTSATPSEHLLEATMLPGPRRHLPVAADEVDASVDAPVVEVAGPPDPADEPESSPVRPIELVEHPAVALDGRAPSRTDPAASAVPVARGADDRTVDLAPPIQSLSVRRGLDPRPTQDPPSPTPIARDDVLQRGLAPPPVQAHGGAITPASGTVGHLPVQRRVASPPVVERSAATAPSPPDGPSGALSVATSPSEARAQPPIGTITAIDIDVPVDREGPSSVPQDAPDRSSVVLRDVAETIDSSSAMPIDPARGGQHEIRQAVEPAAALQPLATPDPDARISTAAPQGADVEPVIERSTQLQVGSGDTRVLPPSVARSDVQQLVSTRQVLGAGGGRAGRAASDAVQRAARGTLAPHDADVAAPATGRTTAPTVPTLGGSFSTHPTPGASTDVGQGSAGGAGGASSMALQASEPISLHAPDHRHTPAPTPVEIRALATTSPGEAAWHAPSPMSAGATGDPSVQRRTLDPTPALADVQPTVATALAEHPPFDRTIRSHGVVQRRNAQPPAGAAPRPLVLAPVQRIPERGVEVDGVVVDAGAVAVAANLATRGEGGSVEFIQRLTDAPDATPDLPAPTATSSPSVADAVASSGGTPAVAAPTASAGDLDELAKQLYDRIRWRLRAELRLDMERAGLGAGVHR